MKTVEYTIPEFFLHALFYDDESGLSDDDYLSLNIFLDDCWSKHGHFYPIATGEHEGYLRYHDMQSHGVLACDCQTVIFDVERV